mgnify:CR=1 FL=1
MSEMWVLSGIAVMVAGFVLRFNPLLVVVAAAAVTGLTAGLELHAIVAAFGKAFNDTRYVTVVWIVLPVIGLLEAHGLQERARGLIAGLRGATTGRRSIAARTPSSDRMGSIDTYGFDGPSTTRSA